MLSNRKYINQSCEDTRMGKTSIGLFYQKWVAEYSSMCFHNIHIKQVYQISLNIACSNDSVGIEKRKKSRCDHYTMKCGKSIPCIKVMVWSFLTTDPPPAVVDHSFTLDPGWDVERVNLDMHLFNPKDLSMHKVFLMKNLHYIYIYIWKPSLYKYIYI